MLQLQDKTNMTHERHPTDDHNSLVFDNHSAKLDKLLDYTLTFIFYLTFFSSYSAGQAVGYVASIQDRNWNMNYPSSWRA
jgi:hypothetical protein